MDGNASNQTAVLQALCALGRCVTIDELAAGALNRRQVANGAAGLIARGLAERRERGCYEATAAGMDAVAQGVALTSGPKGPMERKRIARASLRERLWRAMRMRRKFALADLLQLATTGSERAASANAGRYIRALVAAGVLTELRRATPEAAKSNGCKRYALIRDTGPLAPVARQLAAEVYDPNTGIVHPCREGGDDV